MRKRESFWTPKLLRDLRVKSKRLSIEQLVIEFGKPDYEIIQAIRFEQQSRKLRKEPYKETINGRRVTITVYGAEFAEGAKHAPIVWAGHELY